MDDCMCSPTVPSRTPVRLRTLGRIRRNPRCGGVRQRPLASQDVPVLIPCPPGIAAPAPAREQHLVSLPRAGAGAAIRSEEHTSELQSLTNLVCRLLPEKKKAILPPLTLTLSATYFFFTTILHT